MSYGENGSEIAVDVEVATRMDGAPMRAVLVWALSGLSILDVETRMHGYAFVVGCVRVGVDGEMWLRLALGLQLLSELADQLVFALVLVF